MAEGGAADGPPSSSSSSSMVQFMLAVGKLKTEKRTGWVRKGIHLPESISDHMHRMGVLSLLLGAEEGVRADRCVKMSLVHDLAECIVGDITPYCGVPKEEKHRRELEAMERLTGMLPTPIGTEIFGLWSEYEEATTAEARMVKDFDKFEMLLQAYEYERAEHKPGFLQEFFDSVKGKIRHPVVQGWEAELRAQRTEALKEQATDR